MYADIIIDISHEQLDKTFQYAVPDDMDGSVDIGTSVRVPFGKGNRIITGYVIGLTDKPSYPVDKIKSIDSVVTGKVNVAFFSYMLISSCAFLVSTKRQTDFFCLCPTSSLTGITVFNA